MMIVAVATMGSASLSVSNSNLNKANVAGADATAVMRQVVEELESRPFEEIYARFNGNPADDPDGAGTARGSQFTLQPGHAAAFLDTGTPAPAAPERGISRTTVFDVEITFPEDENGLLSEEVVAPMWGSQSWDIDGNGEVSVGDRSADYKLLPVGVRVTWTDPDGIHALEVVRLMSRRR